MLVSPDDSPLQNTSFFPSFGSGVRQLNTDCVVLYSIPTMRMEWKRRPAKKARAAISNGSGDITRSDDVNSTVIRPEAPRDLLKNGDYSSTLLIGGVRVAEHLLSTGSTVQ